MFLGRSQTKCAKTAFKAPLPEFKSPEYKIINRKGDVEEGKQEKITLAISSAFMAQNNGVYSEALVDLAKSLTQKVLAEVKVQVRGMASVLNESQSLTPTPTTSGPTTSRSTSRRCKTSSSAPSWSLPLTPSP